MESLLTGFGEAFGGSAALALPAAFAWGVLSVALSPCHLSSVPLVVAYMSGGAELPSGRRALQLSSAFAGGILASILLIGIATAAAGRMFGDVGRIGNWVLAVIFLAVGLNLVGVLPLPSLGAPPARARGRGAPGALLLGLAFGTALGPCTFAFLAPLLGMVFRAGGSGALGYGASLVALFGAGHAGAIALAGASAQAANRWAGSRMGARTIPAVRTIAGVAVIAGGAYFVWSAT